MDVTFSFKCWYRFFFFFFFNICIFLCSFQWEIWQSLREVGLEAWTQICSYFERCLENTIEMFQVSNISYWKAMLIENLIPSVTFFFQINNAFKSRTRILRNMGRSSGKAESKDHVRAFSYQLFWQKKKKE